MAVLTISNRPPSEWEPAETWNVLHVRSGIFIASGLASEATAEGVRQAVIDTKIDLDEHFAHYLPPIDSAAGGPGTKHFRDGVILRNIRLLWQGKLWCPEEAKKYQFGDEYL